MARSELRAVDDDFTEVSAAPGIEVTVEMAERASVSLESDGNVLPLIETRVEWSVLIVAPRDGFLLEPSRAIRVTVAAPHALTVRPQTSAEAALLSTTTTAGGEADAPQADLIKGSVIGGPQELPESGGVDPVMAHDSSQMQ